MTSVVLYPQRYSRLASLIMSPSILARSHESISSGLNLFIGLPVSSVKEIKEILPSPRFVAAALLARAVVENLRQGFIEVPEALRVLALLDSKVYDASLSAESVVGLVSILSRMGFRIRVFVHGEPIIYAKHKIVSYIPRGFRLADAEAKLLEKLFDKVRSKRRLEMVRNVFNELKIFVEEFFEPKFEEPMPKSFCVDVLNVGEVLVTLHERNSPEISRRPGFFAHKAYGIPRVSVHLNRTDRLEIPFAYSSMFLLDERTYASFELIKTFLLIESPVGYDPEMAFGTEAERLADKLEPGVLYGVLTNMYNTNVIETYLDQLNAQSMLPTTVKDGRLIIVSAEYPGGFHPGLSLLSSHAPLIEDMLKSDAKEERSVPTNFFVGYLVNSRLFTKAGRYLGRGKFEGKNGGKVTRAIFGKRAPGCVSVSPIPPGDLYAYLYDDVIFYVNSERRPERIAIDECLESGRSPIFFDDGERTLGRCVEEVYDLFDRDPFLLRCLKDRSMDVERRLPPTVAAFLLGVYSLFKPRAYIKYEVSPLNAASSTSVTFHTLTFSPRDRAPAGVASLIIALAILLARIVGPIISGERPTAYLALIGLALTFYIGALIGIFSRNYDYLFSLKYTTRYLMANESTFMMYTVTIAEGGRAVVLGMLLLIVALILEAYNVRKSS